MAPKSAAALVLLAAMIAGLAPPLQAQRKDDIFWFRRVISSRQLCFSDDVIKSCASKLVTSGFVPGARIPKICCRALLEAVTSGKGKRCACGFGEVAADLLGVDVDRMCQDITGPSKLKESCMRAPGNVDRRCQAAIDGGVAGGPSKLKWFCMRARGN